MGKIWGSQPLCWPCWVMLQPGREPVRVKDQEPIPCAVCGTLHITGIFMRMKHDEVNFPNYDKENE